MNFALITIDNKQGLAGRIADVMDKTLHVALVKRFADGEMVVTVDNPTYWIGNTAVIIQSTSAPVHEHVLQVAFLAQELKNAGAIRVIAVIPYFGYARQDASDMFGKYGHVCVIAQLLQAAGVDELITVELHKPSIKKFFSIPVHNIQLTDLIAQQITQAVDLSLDACIVAPDEGARERAQLLADKLLLDCVVLHKERYATNQTRVTGMEGECVGMSAILVDDIIDTAGTAIKACAKIIEQGIHNVYGFFIHPVFSQDALERVDSSLFKQLFVTNTIELPIGKLSAKIVELDISHHLAEIIYKVVEIPIRVESTMLSDQSYTKNL